MTNIAIATCLEETNPSMLMKLRTVDSRMLKPRKLVLIGFYLFCI